MYVCMYVILRTDLFGLQLMVPGVSGESGPSAR